MSTPTPSLAPVPPAAEEVLRPMPHDLEAEQVVLGSLLHYNEHYNQMGDFLKETHFFEPVHGRIYAAIAQFMDKGLVATPVTLKSRFAQDEGLEELGGASYLAQMAGTAGAILNPQDYARIVYNLAVSRELVQIGREMMDQAYQASGDERAAEQIEGSEHRLFTLASEGSSDTHFQPLSHSLTTAIDMADAASRRRGAISGIATGYEDLDNLLGGLHPSDLLILAARPSMGKTSLALNLALHAARRMQQEHEELKQNDPETKEKIGSVGFISLEMSAEQLSTRLLSMETGINAIHIRRGKLSKQGPEDDFSKLIQASTRLHALPLYIDDTPALSIAALRTRARRLKRKHNLQLLMVDYLQLLRGVHAHSQQSRVQEISEISMGLKAIAKELNIPVLALSQLSRQVENREDKRPQLADLRESGSIEQDADVVMFIYREAYYMERSKPADPVEGSESYESDRAVWEAWWQKYGEHYERIKNRTDILVSKHRHGPIGNVPLVFNASTTGFVSAARAPRRGFDEGGVPSPGADAFA